MNLKELNGPTNPGEYLKSIGIKFTKEKNKDGAILTLSLDADKIQSLEKEISSNPLLSKFDVTAVKNTLKVIDNR